MNIRFTPEAEFDLIEVENHYLSIAPHLADQFLKELLSCLGLVSENPNAGIPLRKSFRYFHLTRFPYLVIYELSAPDLVVVHVLHNKRHPKIRKKRTK